MAAYTTIDNPELYFQVLAYTGNGSSGRSITLDGSENMQPDLISIKNRGQTDNWHNWDSVRGVNKAIQWSTSNAENSSPSSGYVSAFNTDGFTATTGSGSDDNLNKNTETYVAYCWKAGGSASSNSDGAQSTSVSASTTSGFSIVSYTGTGTTTNFGHGLGAKPNVILIKSLASNDWVMNGDFLGSTTWQHKLILNTNGTKATANNFNDQAPTSSVWYLNSIHGTTNASSQAFIAYCFAEKQGFSKFGSYTGNGNADGTFVFTGMRPAFILLKNTTTSSRDWMVYDNKRQGYNGANNYLVANTSGSDQTGIEIDILSNGFKARASATGLNASGATMIYMACGEQPFVNSNGVPCNAR